MSIVSYCCAGLGRNFNNKEKHIKNYKKVAKTSFHSLILSLVVPGLVSGCGGNVCLKGFGGSPGALFEGVWRAMFGRRIVMDVFGKIVDQTFLPEVLTRVLRICRHSGASRISGISRNSRILFQAFLLFPCSFLL